MKKKAIFAAGCFWGVEDAFMEIDGVLSTRVGYIGGFRDQPTYEEVRFGDTGHAEAVEMVFDDEKISYDQLLDVFWSIHNPTTLNKQGPDIGSQYRSAIFFAEEQQKELALKSKQKQQQFLKDEIATEITPASEFFLAEEYHQQYFKKTGKSSCNI